MKRALIVIISGGVIGFGSFFFALINMGLGALNAVNGNFESIIMMFAGHLGAMAGLAFGGLVSSVGFGLLIYELVKLVKQ